MSLRCRLKEGRGAGVLGVLGSGEVVLVLFSVAGRGGFLLRLSQRHLVCLCSLFINGAGRQVDLSTPVMILNMRFD